MNSKIFIFVIGAVLGIGIFVYQFYMMNREQLIFNFTGELTFDFASTTPGYATYKCAKLGGISLDLKNDLDKATCYKWKQL